MLVNAKVMGGGHIEMAAAVKCYPINAVTYIATAETDVYHPIQQYTSPLPCVTKTMRMFWTEASP